MRGRYFVFGDVRRAAYVVASVMASRRLQVATRFFERHSRQPPRRSGFGTRDWPCSVHQGRWGRGNQVTVDPPIPGTTCDKGLEISNAPIVYLIPHMLGTWTDKDNFYLVNISSVDGQIKVRECYGANSGMGTMFTATYANGRVVANGNTNDFYKGDLPEFSLLPSGELRHGCGACGPDLLKRTTRRMPNIAYSPPENRD